MLKRILVIFSFVAVNGILLAQVQADGLGGSRVETSPIPRDLQGLYPIHVPKLDGVEQLLVLSDRWVILVSNQMPELFSEIDKSSGEKLSETVKTWIRSQENGRPNWKAYKGRWKIRDKYIATAREKIGERRLGHVDYFVIENPEGSTYSRPIHPKRADRLLVSAGESRTTGGVFKIDYYVYSYLEFPEPMREGEKYKITLGNGNSVEFVFDRKYTVSRAIKVNQLGYLPSAGHKRAYLGAYLYRFGPLDLSHANRFEIINASTGKVSFSGAIKLLEANPRFGPTKKNPDKSTRPLMYGEDVYVADFTELKEEGVFFISVPGVGRSWPFRHTASVYGPAYYTSMRGLFHQRAGSPVRREYSPWTRKKAPRGPYCESDHIAFPRHVGGPKKYNRFDVIGGSIDCSSVTAEIPGGWHDAADWDSNSAHYTVVFDLLNAYAFYPERFTDRQLNLPESGNGIPDILDEARYGLEIWRHSMDERGGISGMLETWTHPKIDDNSVRYAFAQRTRWTSLVFAAAAAQYAQLVKPFDSKDSELFQEAAKRAYEFGVNQKNSLGKTIINARTKRGKGEPYTIEWTEEKDYVNPYLLHAKIRLYLLTKDKGYLDEVWKLAKTSQKPYLWRFTRMDFSPWIYYSLLEAYDVLPGLVGRDWRRWFIKDANNLIAHLDSSPYSVTWPRKQDYWLGWGNSVMTNFNRTLFIAHKLTGEKKYRDAAILNIDFMLGANPMGMSWTTGLGYVYPVDIQHEPSEIDGIYDPVPGITIYGITGGPVYHRFREGVWQSPIPNGTEDFVSHKTHRKPPLWRRWMAHPHLNVGKNEFTLQETMSSTIFTSALLMPKNWMPAESELGTEPRKPSDLYGRWYLP